MSEQTPEFEPNQEEQEQPTPQDYEVPDGVEEVNQDPDWSPEDNEGE